MLLFGALDELGFNSFLDRMKLTTQLTEMLRDEANLRAYEPVYPCTCPWLKQADIFVVWKAVPILVMWLKRTDILVVWKAVPILVMWLDRAHIFIVWMKRGVQIFVMWLK